MADSRLIKVITSQYKRFLRQPEDNIIIVMDDTNIMEWYAMIVLDTEIYKNGEFIFKLTLPIDYPHSPPSCVAMTKNPIFEQGGPLCINISEFHRKQYIASLGAVGFAKQLWNALLFFTFEDSINSIRVTHSSDEVKTKLSLESYDYNKKNNIYVMTLIDNYIEEHPDFEAVKLLLTNRES